MLLPSDPQRVVTDVLAALLEVQEKLDDAGLAMSAIHVSQAIDSLRNEILPVAAGQA